LPPLQIDGVHPYLEVGSISIVEGLDGTGDGDWSLLREMLAAVYPGRQFGTEELRSFAVVVVTGKVGVPIEVGAPVEVDVSPMYIATRLAGGKLIKTTLSALPYDDDIRASAEGDVAPSLDGFDCNGHVVQAGRVTIPPKRLIVPSGPATASREPPRPGGAGG
jgi:flagellar basal body P-ring protein FlgI